MQGILALLGFGYGERRQFSLLVENFFDRFFFNDLISSQDEIQRTAGNIVAVLCFPSLAMALYKIPKYYFTLASRPASERDLAVLTDKATFVSFSMALIGLLIVLEWEALFPDRRDYVMLTVLPVRLRTLFLAKFAALGIFTGLFFVIINVASMVFFPMAAVPEHASLVEGLGFAASYSASLLLASLFVVLFFVSLQGVLLNVLSFGAFRRLSPWAQLTSMFVLFSMLLLLPTLSSLFAPGNEKVSPFFYPPMWFVGLSEVLSGTRNATLRSLGFFALWALLAAILGGVITYSLAYRRHVRKSLESVSSRPRPASPGVASLLEQATGLALRQPRERAVFSFVTRAMLRSPQHRLYLAAFLGVALSFALAQLLTMWPALGGKMTTEPSVRWLTIPLIFSFFTLVGMRTIFVVPAELQANWIFRLTAGQRTEEYLAGVRKAMVFCGVLPLAIFLLPVTALWWGGTHAGVHLVFFSFLSCILIEALLFDFQKIPFTCSYLPGSANVIFLWGAYGIAFLTYTYTMAAVELRVLRNPSEWLLTGAMALALLLVWRGYRREFHEPALTVIFEESSDPIVQRLNLRP